MPASDLVNVSVDGAREVDGERVALAVPGRQCRDLQKQLDCSLFQVLTNLMFVDWYHMLCTVSALATTIIWFKCPGWFNVQVCRTMYDSGS